MLGQIPGGNLRGYWRLEDLTDLSGNGKTLTNNNSVTFSGSKFGNGADFGSSGTNKGLSLGSNPMSVEVPGNVSVMFTFKLNNISASNTNAVIFALNTKTSATNGLNLSARYNISGGNITIVASSTLSGGAAEASINFTADTNIHLVQITKIGTLILLSIDRNRNANTTGSGTDTSLTSAPTIFFMIGNNRALASSAWMIIDEFILGEGIYAASDGRDRAKYFIQWKRGFCL